MKNLTPFEKNNFINGQWRPSEAGKKFESRNPANYHQLIGAFPDSDLNDVHEAVIAAQKAFETWRLVPAPKRGEILFRAAEILLNEKEPLANLLVHEMGKVIAEARGDIQEAVDMAYYAAAEGRRLFGQTTQSELKNKAAYSIRTPVGVCGLITPWNFPVAIPAWKIFPALIAGNTIVFKPAEDTPATASRFVEILDQAGLPPGVLNLVQGGATTGRALVAHPGIRLISFTGSSEAGKQVAAECGRALKRCSLELGGKNAQIVLNDANLDLAVEGALWGSYGTAGQRCTATSRIFVQKNVYQKFLTLFSRQSKKLVLGSGLNPKVHIGPLINRVQLERVHDYVQKGIHEGAKLMFGGKIPADKKFKNGFFYEPTLFTEVSPNMKIMKEEIFGPVTCVMPVKNLEDAIQLANQVDYGLSSSVYTQNINQSMQAIRDIEAGITYINGPTIGAEVHLPFGGVKSTGNGHREAGSTAIEVFCEWKSVYIDYSGKLQKAQMDE